MARVLCFGDSLTSGYHGYGLGEHPYAHALQRLLRARLPDAVVVADGQPGDVVSRPAFARRLRRQLAARSFDWVVVLAGTNDLGHAVPVIDILAALQACWDMALAAGSKVLALTVPECAARVERLDSARRALNAAIFGHDQPDFHSFDLFAKIPYHSLPEHDRAVFWDDGLHLTPDGYDWMGHHVATALLAILDRQHPPGAPEPATPKDHADGPGDSQAFDEEEGSPDVISQGYVVVRRRDLE